MSAPVVTWHDSEARVKLLNTFKMNLEKHFGDSYDVVKKSFLSWIADLGPWCAHPMFMHDVTEKAAEQFSRFLGVPLISRERLHTGSDRLAYLGVCSHSRHVFLDPDTGLRLGSGKAPQYLFSDELVRLAEARPRFLTLTFDQSLSREKDAALQVRSKLEHLMKRGIFGFAYVSHAAFIAVGKDYSLVRRTHEMIVRQSGLPASRFVVATSSKNAIQSTRSGPLPRSSASPRTSRTRARRG